MPLEVELKLALRPADLPKLLAHPLLPRPQAHRQRLLNTYYDTPTLALMAQRVAVRERLQGRQRLLTVKTAGVSVGGVSRRGEWEAPTRAGAFDFAALVDDVALAQTLSSLAWQLVPVFRTDFVRLSWQLQWGGAHIEVALDRGEISTGEIDKGGRNEALLELELELKAGPPDALLDLAHTLALSPGGVASQGLWLYPSDLSKAARGLALFLGHTPKPLRAPSMALTPDMAAVTAFREAALGCLTHFQANTSGLLDALAQAPAGALPDPEFIHQARVALRRLRTGLSLFAPHLPRRFTAHWQSQWRATAQALSPARDWDVLTTEGLPAWLDAVTDARARDDLLTWADTRRREALQLAMDALTTPAHAQSLLAFARALQALPVATGPSGSLSAWARQQLRQRRQRMPHAVRRALREGPEGRHALRIELKKLRYAQTFLAPLLPPGPTRRRAAALAQAQALLGRLNDLATAQTLLADVPAAVAPAAQAVQERLQALLAQGLQSLPGVERQLLKRIA